MIYNRKSGSPLRLFSDIFRNIWNLPKPIQRICNVQFFAWIGWFPFLFYSTTWVAEIYNKTSNDSTVADQLGQATRAGSFAFLVYSLVSLSSSFLLPLIVTPSSAEEEQHYKIEETVFTLKLFGKKREFRPSSYLGYLKLSFLTLPRAWTISHFIFCICMLSTLFVSDVTAAAIIIGLCGISWAISMWAPFSLLGEYISKQEARQHKLAGGDDQDQHQETTENTFVHHSYLMASRASLALGMIGEPAMYQPLSNGPYEEDEIEMLGVKKKKAQEIEDVEAEGSGSNEGEESSQYEEEQPQHRRMEAPAAGVLLGIHNMYIVLPQFLVTFFSSIIFRLLETSDTLNEAPRDTIGLILRIGAVVAGIAGFISMRIGKE